MTLFCVLFLQRIIQEWRTKTPMNRIQNLKFHCWTDTSLFTTSITWLNAASSGHVSRRGRICGWSPFALRLQTGPDIRHQLLSFDTTVTWRNFIICRECNITAYEIIYHLDAIEYLFVFFQLDMFRAYTPIFRSNACPQDRHLTTPRTPYAAYVKKL